MGFDSTYLDYVAIGNKIRELRHIHNLSQTELADQLGMNCTLIVRQYVILNNDWGVLLCQKGYQMHATQENLSARWWRTFKKIS